METLFLALVPVVLFGVFVAYRRVARRPLLRRTTDTVFALLLLVYFAITAGLGVFWVARQELPVFDWHYLFGYATALLVVIHMALNWRALVAMFRRQPAWRRQDGVDRADTAFARSPTSRGTPGRLRLVGWSAALVVYGCLALWLGLWLGSSRVEVIMAESSPRSAQAPGERTEQTVKLSTPDDGTTGRRAAAPTTRTTPPPADLPATSLPNSGLPATGLPAPEPIQHQWVESGGGRQGLAEHYHAESALSRLKLLWDSGGWPAGSRPSLYKEYTGAEVVVLPEPRAAADVSVGASIEACREPVTAFDPGAISLADLSTILFMANGVTSTLHYPGGDYDLRAAPSAGALYPTDTYVLASNVSDLSPGLYHYAVKGHQLQRVSGGDDLAGQLAALVPHGHLVEEAPATLIFTSVYFRSSWKYRRRAYRYCGMDAGHVYVQAAMAAGALGYGSQPIGRFDDGGVSVLLALNEDEEGPLLIAPVGRRSPTPPAEEGQRAFALQARQLAGPADAMVLAVQGGTRLGAASAIVADYAARGPVDEAYTDLPVVSLPKDSAGGDDVFAAIRRRRSVRDWADRSLTLRELSSVLHHAFGIAAGDGAARLDPSVEQNHALNLYAVVHKVEDVEPGVYYYRRYEHALTRLRSGKFRRKAYTASLSQDVVGKCAVALIITIDRQRFGDPDSDRGYRYAALDAGALGGRVYVQATGLGLGCCGIGAFYDDDVSNLIEVKPTEELPIYMLAVGADPAHND